MSITQQMLAVIAPVMLIMGSGFVWSRKGLPFDHSTITLLVSSIGTPCLLLHAFLTIKPDLRSAITMIAAAIVLLLTMGFAGWLLLRLCGLSARTFLPSIIFPNMGNMGLPLCLFAFGETGLVLAIILYATTSIFQFSVGLSIARGSFATGDLLRNPALIAIFLATFMRWFDVEPPTGISKAVETLGQMTIPLMLLSLGTALADLRPTDLKSGLGVSVLRIAGGFIAALTISCIFGLTGAARGTLLIQASMPSAVFSYLFALRFNNSPAAVANVVFLSTLLSFATLPVLVAFAL